MTDRPLVYVFCAIRTARASAFGEEWEDTSYQKGDDLHPGETRPLQFVVPLSVFEAFSERAAQEFGRSKGSKKVLFLKM